MDIRLIRNEFSEVSTIGDLYLLPDIGIFCHTLEDVTRESGVKIPKQTAIPFGKYEVIFSWSDRFQRRLPLLLDVPMFTGVRIHSGNTSADTEGCILVGDHKEKDRVTDSRAALARLLARLAMVWETEKVWISIERG